MYISSYEWLIQKISPPSIRDVEAFLRDATIGGRIREAVATRARIESPAEILPLLDDGRISRHIRRILVRGLLADVSKIEFAEIVPLLRVPEVTELFSSMLTH